MTKRINLISGPRNISTAMMYSWANRLDTRALDEPLYAYYLSQTGINYHPGTNEIINSLPSNYNSVLENLIFCDVDKPLYFIKGMAHHIINCGLDFLLQLENVFLIRDPAQIITSFAKVIEKPTMQDIGLKRQWELYSYLREQGSKVFILDSNDVLNDPRGMLRKLCELLKIPFSERMLSWTAGPIKEDGVWAKYWYSNVWKSTGFTAPDNRPRVVPQELEDLYKEAITYYDRLKEVSISV